MWIYAYVCLFVQYVSMLMFVCCRLSQWNSMTREQKAKYYAQAEMERLLHAQRHPGWSTRDNYVSTPTHHCTAADGEQVTVAESMS